MKQSQCVLALIALSTTSAATVFAGETNFSVKSAQYSVPVSAELAPYSSFSLTGATLQIIEGKRVLQFYSPEDLVGNATTLTVLTEDAAPTGNTFIPFSSPRAEARCISSSPNKLLCLLKNKSAPDLRSSEAFLTKKYANDPNHLASSIAVVRIFHNEPSGVLNFEFEM